MTQEEAKTLAEALTTKFGGESEFEVVNAGRYRFSITSKEFDAMTQLQRQDEVWKIAEKTLSREAILDVSMILAFAPRDLSTKP
jgi:hypothetical protein